MTEAQLYNSKKKLTDYYCSNKIDVDYKDIDNLKKFISNEGKILPSRRTGLIAKNQRKITKAIKRARVLNLLPFVNPEA